MRWIVFAVVSWVVLGVQIGTARLIEVGQGVAPSIVLAFATFIALSAGAGPALTAGLLLGLCVDLTSSVGMLEGSPPAVVAAVVVGPWALGYLAAMQLVLVLRPLTMRRNPLAIGFVTLTAAFVALAVRCALIWLRGLIAEDPATPVATELVTGLGACVYTAIAAVPLAVVFGLLAGPLGLPVAQKRFVRRIG